MFLRNDIYTTSGSTKLYHCWTPNVTKFDASSFYNFEQDNLPLYDLDERTHYLWEQLGYPTSAIPGVALVVSADAPASAITCNKNVFRSLSAAIDALPQTINYPIILEVGNFGNLGELHLKNIRFGSRGSLEIINRNFSFAEYTASSGFGLQIPQVSADYYNGTNTHNYVSAFRLFAGLPFVENISPMQGFLDSSCLSISSPVFSSTTDMRFSAGTSKLNGYVSPWKVGSNYNKSTLIIDSKNTVSPFIDAYGLQFTPYAFNPESSDDIYAKDASTVDYLNGSALVYETNNTALNPYRAFNGLYYGNKLSNITIVNCDGPIYIRNFFLDGSGSTVTSNKVGVLVENSTNVFLENMVSTRFREAGFKFSNSKVNLLRSCVANRNYDFDSSNKRKSGNYASRRIGPSYLESSGYSNQPESAGLVAYNSVINLSSTRSWEASRYAEELGSSFIGLPKAYHVMEFNDNDNGIILNNSTLEGGDSASATGVTYLLDSTILDANCNVGYGLLARNSTLNLNGKIRALENLNGVKAVNCVLELEEFEAKRNQVIGIDLIGSNLSYNKNLKKFHASGTYDQILAGYPYDLGLNGININLLESTLKPVITSSMESIYPEFRVANTIGTSQASSVTESIKATGNSFVYLVSPRLTRDDNHSESGAACRGSELACNNGSKALLRGTRYFPTRVVGPDTRNNQKNLAALASLNNSELEINGPTIVAQFGIDILGEDGSVVDLCSPKGVAGSIVDSSSINLSDPANHTMIELHSTRACIVANRSSTVNMKDLGSYRNFWNVTGTFDSFGLDYGGNSTANQYNTAFVSGGSLQFYPNPNSVNPVNAAISVTALGAFTNLFTEYTGGYGALLPLNTTPLGFSAVTYGGMCVRAVNDSHIQVDNVRFPAGWWNASAPYYDQSVTFDSGGACYRPFIWNIADTSRLKASFVSVSSVFPRLAGYTGPYGYWTSGSGNRAASGAPSTTPDTSSTSILDLYGTNPSGLAFTTSSAKNYGPFRLYFGVNPMVNSLTELDGSSNAAIIRQVYAQGYQPSNSLICSGDPSAIYAMALQRNSSNSIVPSGYYYGSGIADNAGYLRVTLDESAAETFANAKHCAAGKSGNARLVAIYYPYNTIKYGDSVTTLGVASTNLFDIERDN